MTFTAAAIRATKLLEGGTLKLSDGGGLQLWVAPSGSKLWHIAYRFSGKQLSCGWPQGRTRAAGRGQATLGSGH